MRISVYQLKPAFQKLLNVPVQWLKGAGVSPNQVTLAALTLSLIYGLLLWQFPTEAALWAALPLVLLLRMALNAIDGLLARVSAQQTRFGALFNELADQMSDAALYLPFAYATGIRAEFAVLAVLLAGLAEFAGVLAVTVGSARGFAGPMGKSDRAVAFSVLAILVAAKAPEIWKNALLLVILLLLIWTILNRVKAALGRV